MKTRQFTFVRSTSPYYIVLYTLRKVDFITWLAGSIRFDWKKKTKKAHHLYLLFTRLFSVTSYLSTWRAFFARPNLFPVTCWYNYAEIIGRRRFKILRFGISKCHQRCEIAQFPYLRIRISKSTSSSVRYSLISSTSSRILQEMDNAVGGGQNIVIFGVDIEDGRGSLNGLKKKLSTSHFT